MVTIIENLRHMRLGRRTREAAAVPVPTEERERPPSPAVDIAPDDPIIPYFTSAPGTVDIESLNLNSPALGALRAAGVKMVVPLVSQGELVGLLHLGPRLSQQDYSTDDRGLLNNLATQAAPALRVAQLVREQQAEAAERERLEQELRVARLIQQTLLPRELPALPGWRLAAYYQPARAVGGDFYDFLYLDGGRLGIVIGDVTDKGVPAALVMATTRSILRSAARGGASPGEVLERTNDLLHPDIPPKMFVTCLYAILDPSTGRLLYANAGHDLPYCRHRGRVSELRATGMPLGLMPGMDYEEKELSLSPGDTILFYSDGLVEAHNPKREMFSFPRLMSLISEYTGTLEMIDFLLGRLATFTGEGWEQEDDVTMVTLEKSGGEGLSTVATASPTSPVGFESEGDWRTLGEWEMPSEPGNEQQAMERVAKLVEGLGLSDRRLEELKTAVAEATMNAMEHGNHYRPDVPVGLRVRASSHSISVQITDRGGNTAIPEPVTPDLQAKLEGLQSPRGWGLFLIKNLVDDMRVSSDEVHHTVELIMRLGGDTDGR